MEHMEPQTDLLNPEDLKINFPRRRSLLPWWVKIFTWIFIVLGSVVCGSFIFALLGFTTTTSLYGLESKDPFSLTGILLGLVYLLKGFTGFSLWLEKDWAILAAKVDAALGLAICIYMMCVVPFFSAGFIMNLRLELVLLIPYLVWAIKTKIPWEESKRIEI